MDKSTRHKHKHNSHSSQWQHFEYFFSQIFAPLWTIESFDHFCVFLFFDIKCDAITFGSSNDTKEDADVYAERRMQIINCRKVDTFIVPTVHQFTNTQFT